jgi:hypothetical protein
MCYQVAKKLRRRFLEKSQSNSFMGLSFKIGEGIEGFNGVEVFIILPVAALNFISDSAY